MKYMESSRSVKIDLIKYLLHSAVQYNQRSYHEWPSFEESSQSFSDHVTRNEEYVRKCKEVSSEKKLMNY